MLFLLKSAPRSYDVAVAALINNVETKMQRDAYLTQSLEPVLQEDWPLPPASRSRAHSTSPPSPLLRLSGCAPPQQGSLPPSPPPVVSLSPFRDAQSFPKHGQEITNTWLSLRAGLN